MDEKLTGSNPKLLNDQWQRTGFWKEDLYESIGGNW